MQLRTKKAMLAPLLLAILCGCGGRNTNLKASEYRGKFQDQQIGLSFVCPERWEVRENVQGHRVVARSPLENRQDPFQENLVVSAVPGAQDTAAALMQAESDFKAKLEGFQRLETPGAASDVLLFQHQLKGQQLQCRAHFLANPRGGVWMLLFTSTAKDFPRWQTEFDNIAASFGKTIPELLHSPTPGVATETPAGTETPAPSASQTPSTPTATPTEYTPAAAPLTATPAEPETSSTPEESVSPTPAAPSGTPGPAGSEPGGTPGATATP